jgi:hypothetical protein
MAKRASTTSEETRKQPCKKSLLQASLFKFYKPDHDDGSNLKPKPPPVLPTPSKFNIHLYSKDEIERARGLNKLRLQFWNDKAVEICSDKSMTDELNNNREAIEGAIHSSWTLHKTSLLELEVEELEDKAILVYDDEVAREVILKNVKKNRDRMQTAHATIHALSNIIAESSESQKVPLENQLSQEISELKKAQDALSKAIQRSSVTAKPNKDSVMAAPSPIKLSDTEFSTLITEVKNEYTDESVEKD